MMNLRSLQNWFHDLNNGIILGYLGWSGRGVHKILIDSVMFTDSPFQQVGVKRSPN